jgi:hypothetical protein
MIMMFYLTLAVGGQNTYPNMPNTGGVFDSKPSSIIQYQTAPGRLVVTATVAGPSSEVEDPYITPGKVLEYTVSVRNDGGSEADVDLSINPGTCSLGWLGWTTENLVVPAGATRSKVLLVKPDIGAIAGSYKFDITASSMYSQSGYATGYFQVQDYDYASETSVSGTGQFKIKKDVRSMNSGIKSNKDVYVSGYIDALVKNEYLVDEARGKNPNFEEKDVVDNYVAMAPGDALLGSESFKSSAVFGGIGAKIQESYNVQEMEFENQSFNLHQTGSMKKMAEFNTADNFTGYYAIDAKQIVPGAKNLNEHDEFLGSYEIKRKILFKDRPIFAKPICFGDECHKSQKPAPSTGKFSSPCQSGTCSGFVNNLNTFISKAS